MKNIKSQEFISKKSFVNPQNKAKLGLIISPFIDKKKKKKKSLIKKLSFDLLKKKSKNGENFFISCKTLRIESPNCFYGCFYLGPFDPGQSMTIGNALRRTLLSELRGIAITSVEIDGALHEYSILPGLQDSVLDILLNLKEIILKKTTAFTFKKSQIGYIRVHGPGIVRAGDLLLPPFLQCVNPDQYIATLSEDGFLNIKLFINEGKNYNLFSDIPLKKKKINYKEKENEKIVSNSFPSYPANTLVSRQSKVTSVKKAPIQNPSSSRSDSVNNSRDKKTNKLYLDSVFMPILKVNYILEENKTVNDFLSAKKSKQNSLYQFNENLMFSRKKNSLVLTASTKGKKKSSLPANDSSTSFGGGGFSKKKKAPFPATMGMGKAWFVEEKETSPKPAPPSSLGLGLPEAQGSSNYFWTVTNNKKGGRMCLDHFAYFPDSIKNPIKGLSTKYPYLISRVIKGAKLSAAKLNEVKSTQPTVRDKSQSQFKPILSKKMQKEKKQKGFQPRIPLQHTPTGLRANAKKGKRCKVGVLTTEPLWVQKGGSGKLRILSNLIVKKNPFIKTCLNNTKRIQSRLKFLKLNNYIYNKTNPNYIMRIKKELTIYPLKKKLRKLYHRNPITSSGNITRKKTKTNVKKIKKQASIHTFFSFFKPLSFSALQSKKKTKISDMTDRKDFSKMNNQYKLLIKKKRSSNAKIRQSPSSMDGIKKGTLTNRKWKRLFKITEVTLQKKFIFNVKKNQYKKKYLSMIYPIKGERKKGKSKAILSSSDASLLRLREKSSPYLVAPTGQRSRGTVSPEASSYKASREGFYESAKQIYLMAKNNKISKTLYGTKVKTNKKNKILTKFRLKNSRTAQDKIEFKHNLILEIWTNGSIHPREALYKAIKILLTTFSKLKQIRFIRNFYKSKTTYKQFLSFFIRKWKKQKKERKN